MTDYIDELRKALEGIGINPIDLRTIVPEKPVEIPNTRRITVTFNPEDDIDDLDYVKVDTLGLDKDKKANRSDVMALALATAKLLAKQCPGIDEQHAGEELMRAVVALQIEGLAKIFAGGKNHG